MVEVKQPRAFVVRLIKSTKHGTYKIWYLKLGTTNKYLAKITKQLKTQ